MVNPGAFSGTRKNFLEAQSDVYAIAVAENHVADTVADIQRRYFKRYPLTLPHDQEPTAEWLATVDDDAPDPEVMTLPLDFEGMNPEADALAAQEREAFIVSMKLRKDVSHSQ
jgi:hypothetical protein